MAKNTQVQDETETFNLGGDASPASNSKVGSGQDTGGDTYDLSGVEEDKAYELLPKGTYNAVVESFDFGDSSKGNPMITVCYEITDVEFAGRKIYDYLVLGGDGAEFGKGKLKKFLLRVCPGADISNFKPQTFADSGEAVGRSCQLVLKITTQKKGEYAGTKRNNVQDILASEGVGGFLS